MVDPVVCWAEGKGRRIQVLVELLSLYNDLVEPSVARDGIAASGERVVQMPVTYTPAVKELERLLKRMHVEACSIHWHVSEYFIRCTVKNASVPVTRRVKGGKKLTVMERQVVRVRDNAVRLEKVRRGVEWLAQNWALESEPFLPAAVLERVAA